MKSVATLEYLTRYVRERPLFLSVLRAKEASLYQQYRPFRHPVLDVGCGDGVFSEITFGRQSIDTGLDTGDSRIDEVRTAGPYKRVVSYDGVSFPFRNRMYSTVVINSVLEHVENLERVLSEIKRVLKNGGVCYATVMAAPWEDHLFGARIFGNRYRRWMKNRQVHINLLSHHEWRRAFVSAGLTPVTVTPYVSPRAASWLDALHYLSLPSLVSYRINRQWVWWPGMTALYPCIYFARIMDEPVSLEDAGALFWVLRRA